MVRGVDTSTVNKWTMLFLKYGLIRKVARSYTRFQVYKLLCTTNVW